MLVHVPQTMCTFFDRVTKALEAAKNNGNFGIFITFDMSSLTFDNSVLSIESFQFCC